MKINRSSAIGIAFGMGAGLCYGIVSILIKHSVGGLSTPLAGAAVSLFIGAVGLGIFGSRGIKQAIISQRKGLIYLLLSGVASAGGIISIFYALDIAPVVVITPVQSTNPLFALFFSYLFLGKLEKITPKLIVGSILVVGGVILITLGQG